MGSKNLEKEDKKTKNKNKSEKLRLSNEARYSKKQKNQIEELGENRLLITPNNKISEKKEENHTNKTPKNISEFPIEEIVDTVSSRIKKEEDKNKTNRLKKVLKPLNLIKLLSSYGVSVDSPIKELIKEIKKRGKSHIEKEIKNL